MKESGHKAPSNCLEDSFVDKKPMYSRGEAMVEANRCIYCADAPCVTACPTGIDIPTFIHKISTDNVKGAARTILEENLLGVSCARVCPVEVLCVGSCVYNHWGREPIEIGRLQRYATETAIQEKPDLIKVTAKEASGKKVALIGAGPASLAAAGYLALDGHSSVLFEKRDLPGGLNTTGIAPYKMKAQDSLAEVNWILDLGQIEIRTGMEVVQGDAAEGQITAADLLEEFDAVFLGLGLGPDSTLSLDGEAGSGVHGAVDLIEKIKCESDYQFGDAKRALVIGGGNTAIDIAHELALLDIPDVVMVYRRGQDRMSAYAHEMSFGRLDGVRVMENRVPLGFVRDGAGKLTGLRVAAADDGKPIPNTEEEIACDLVAVATGQARLTALAKSFSGVELDNKGRIIVDDSTHQTGHAQVFAGGDCVNGGKEVVNAVEHGKRAAHAMSKMWSK
jgi:dihydropyrimidine dehydrogenase (NAD+) subunit PreT